MPGDWTFTATDRPSHVRARWTWPIDAAATGTGPHRANSRAVGAPSSASTTWAASSGAIGGASCWRVARAARTGSGTPSSTKLTSWAAFIGTPFIWPSVTATWCAARVAAPASSSARRPGRATSRRAPRLAAVPPTRAPRRASSALRAARPVASGAPGGRARPRRCSRRAATTPVVATASPTATGQHGRGCGNRSCATDGHDAGGRGRRQALRAPHAGGVVRLRPDLAAGPLQPPARVVDPAEVGLQVEQRVVQQHRVAELGLLLGLGERPHLLDVPGALGVEDLLDVPARLHGQQHPHEELALEEGVAGLGDEDPPVERGATLRRDGVVLAGRTGAGLLADQADPAVALEAGQGGVDLAEIERAPEREALVEIALELVAVPRG